jgi:hypothetical protein
MNGSNSSSMPPVSSRGVATSKASPQPAQTRTTLGEQMTVSGARVEVVPRRCLSRQEAARYIGISVTLFDELVAEGVMPQPFNIRSRKLWDIRALDAAIDALADVEAADKAERERWTRVVA